MSWEEVSWKELNFTGIAGELREVVADFIKELRD